MSGLRTLAVIVAALTLSLHVVAGPEESWLCHADVAVIGQLFSDTPAPAVADQNGPQQTTALIPEQAPAGTGGEVILLTCLAILALAIVGPRLWRSSGTPLLTHQMVQWIHPSLPTAARTSLSRQLGSVVLRT